MGLWICLSDISPLLRSLFTATKKKPASLSEGSDKPDYKKQDSIDAAEAALQSKKGSQVCITLYSMCQVITVMC